MNRHWRVLVFPAATEIGLEINRALGPCKEVTLVGASSVDSCHGDFVYRTHLHLPSVHDAGWLEALNAVVTDQRIDAILPAHDDVVLALAENAGGIAADVITSGAAVCRLARSKSRTYAFFAGHLPVPAVLDPADPALVYPVFVKPDCGQGSQGARVARDATELAAALRAAGQAVVTEYLPGDEFTVDCFSDRKTGLLYHAARRRVRTRSGISMATAAVDDPAFGEMARAINACLELRGAWFFQAKRDRGGRLKLLEFAPRIAGAMAHNRMCGVNFPLLSLYEQARMPVTVSAAVTGVRLDRALANRYSHDLAYDTVYVDFDDTLVLRGGLNTLLVRFLYQCVDRGVKLVLLTRHAGDLAAQLARRRLAGLFDEVHQLAADQLKRERIRPGAALLIDDSFRERNAVSGVPGLTVLAPDQIEMLIDERI